MSNDKKQEDIKKKENEVHEPVPNYEAEEKLILKGSEEIHPILKKLILKSKAESRAGMGMPHDEVVQRLKLKYPFLK